MNWDALGAIGELIGALATLVMLVYLAIQIRQNSSAIRSSSFHAANVAMANALNTDLNVALMAEKDWDARSPGERSVAYNILAKQLIILESMYYQDKQGSIEKDIWASREEHIQFHIRLKMFESFWHERRLFFAEEFRQYIEDRIKAIHGEGPDAFHGTSS